MIIKEIGSANNSQKAWAISRPLAQKAEERELLALDLPVCEFYRVDLNIQSSVFIRELICTLRDHVVWAQTSRVQDVLQFQMDYPMNNYEHFEQIRDRMIEESQHERQDNYRLTLPLFSLTEYAISISIRHLINLYMNIAHIADNCEDELVKASLEKDASNLKTYLHHKGVDSEIIYKHNMKPILNESFVSYQNADLGEYIVVSAKIPLYLRAQLVRHRQLLVADDLFKKVTSPGANAATISNSVNAKIVGTKGFFEQLVSKRSCWIAQYDIWSDLVNNISKYVNVKLPCSDGVCPFEKDVELRLHGKDPNPPCPIYMNLNQIPATKDQVASMLYQRQKDNRSGKWVEEIMLLRNK